MKKRIITIILSGVLFLLCGCNGESAVSLLKYKRISFESTTLGEGTKVISEDATISYDAKETFGTEMPIYTISKHYISEKEIEDMKDNLGISTCFWDEYDGNEILFRLAPYADPVRGAFYTLNMTDAELEKLAWETFNKIPFFDGEYEYVGITGEMEEWTLESGEYQATEVTVSFCRLIDGVRVVGNEKCNLTFDASGLVEIHIEMFDYKKSGTMRMVSLEDAREKLKAPDYFSVDSGTGVAKELQIDRVQLSLVNQHSRGCTILQPIYTFYGEAKLDDGDRSEFKSRIIAIPETITYEEE